MATNHAPKNSPWVRARIGRGGGRGRYTPNTRTLGKCLCRRSSRRRPTCTRRLRAWLPMPSRSRLRLSHQELPRSLRLRDVPCGHRVIRDLASANECRPRRRGSPPFGHDNRRNGDAGSRLARVRKDFGDARVTPFEPNERARIERQPRHCVANAARSSSLRCAASPSCSITASCAARCRSRCTASGDRRGHALLGLARAESQPLDVGGIERNTDFGVRRHSERTMNRIVIGGQAEAEGMRRRRRVRGGGGGGGCGRGGGGGCGFGLRRVARRNSLPRRRPRDFVGVTGILVRDRLATT